MEDGSKRECGLSEEADVFWLPKVVSFTQLGIYTDFQACLACF